MSAFAQSSVQIDGIMDAGYTSAKAYGQNYSLVDQSAARTTTIKFTGKEDLGGGMAANFRFEAQPLLVAGNGNAYNNAINTAAAVSANGTANANGQASQQSGLVGKGYNYVGLSGGFGEVQFGTINYHSLSAFGAGSIGFNTGVGSGYKHNIAADTTRVENAAVYLTPVFNGFQARYTIGTGNDSQYGATTGAVLRRAKADELGLSYDNGPLAIKFANLKSKTSPNEAAASSTAAAASNVTTTTNTLGANYTMGAFKVGYLNQTQKNDAGADTGSVDRHIDTKAQMLYGQYTTGATRLMLSTGNRKTSAGYASTTNLAGLKGTYTGYGVEYDLSKRTFVYLRGQNQTVNDLAFNTVVANGAALTANTFTDKKITVTAVGISHQF